MKAKYRMNKNKHHKEWIKKLADTYMCRSINNVNQPIYTWKQQLAGPKGLEISSREHWGWKSMTENDLAKEYL